MEQLVLADDLSKETVPTIMILYKNTKAVVRSHDDDTDVATGGLQRDTLVPCLLTIHPEYVIGLLIDLVKKMVSH